MTLARIVGGVLITAGIISAPAAAADTLRFSHHHAVGGHLDQTAHRFAELVSEKSGGEITVQVFPAGQLGEEREGIDLLDQGVIDMTITSLAIMDQFWSPIQVTSLPFVWDGWEHADAVMTGEGGEFITVNLKEASNIHLLGVIGGGFRDMLFVGDPVTSVEGMSGLRMRAPEAHLWIRMFELIDARPTPVTWGEIYTAMQTGVADGLEAPPLSVTDMNLQEVMNSAVLTHHMFLTYAININKDRLAAMSEANQTAVLEAGREAAAWSTDYARDANEEGYAIMREAGMEIVDPESPEDWAAAMEPLWDEFAEISEDAETLLDLIINNR